MLTGLAQNATVLCNGKMDCSPFCFEETVSNCCKMDNATEHRNNTSSKSCSPCSQSGGLKLKLHYNYGVATLFTLSHTLIKYIYHSIGQYIVSYYHFNTSFFVRYYKQFVT